MRVHGASGGNPTTEESSRRTPGTALSIMSYVPILGLDRQPRPSWSPSSPSPSRSAPTPQPRLARQVRQHQRHQGGLSSLIDPDDLAARLTSELDERLAEADAQLAARYPGERAGRQPVHTAYVPADAFTAGTARDWGRQAEALLDEHAEKFATVVADADIIRRVKAKLADEPVEDLRIDFEDGYVGHDHADEDEHVRTAAHALAEGQQDGAAPPFAGIRIKSFEAPTRARRCAR